LRGETESVLTYQEKKEVDKQIKILYNPFPSDPSQTRILRTIFQNFSESALCIDGPPGTGKSLVICNLLANSLFYQKKVLVVCEKEVALRVIYDKLASLGLKHSMIKINELNQTSQVYQQILSVVEINQKEEEKRSISNIIEQISKLEEKLKSNLKTIEDYYKVEKEFYSNYQIPLREVYIKFERKNLTSEIIQLSK
jgi:Cdc6-like AAA superfamily ATPase